jgi:hypothetical protein
MILDASMYIYGVHDIFRLYAKYLFVYSVSKHGEV